MKLSNIFVSILLCLFVSSGFSQATTQSEKKQQTEVNVLKIEAPQVTPCNLTQTCPDGQYCNMYAGKKYCTVSAIPPTCLPPTEPNCGLTGECPENYYCSRFERLEFCCITAPLGPD